MHETLIPAGLSGESGSECETQISAAQGAGAVEAATEQKEDEGVGETKANSSLPKSWTHSLTPTLPRCVKLWLKNMKGAILQSLSCLANDYLFLICGGNIRC